MAFSGLHVIAAYAGAAFSRSSSVPIIGEMVWSETLATESTGTKAAPNAVDGAGQPIFRIRSSADSWVCIGPAPNATSGIRFLVPAGTDYDVYAEPGDKVAWIAA